MTNIVVEAINATTFKVTVNAASQTQHQVTAQPEYVQQLTDGKASAETLIKKSFEFLLARESNTSILRSFDLPVIGRYFPEYEATIRKTLS